MQVNCLLFLHSILSIVQVPVFRLFTVINIIKYKGTINVYGIGLQLKITGTSKVVDSDKLGITFSNLGKLVKKR